MKRKFGTFFVIMGSALITAALALFLYNQWEGEQAAQSAAAVMPEIVEVIHYRQELPEASTEPVHEFVEERRMTAVEINGYPYIGFVGLPSLELELPIISEWTYRRLQIAPCRFWGDMYTNDLVVMAHNYPLHFGGLSELRVGDTVTVTDMDAVTFEYEVVAIDVLAPNAIEDMLSGEYDLTLFTCTYGGKSRVTVRCDRTDE